MAAWSSSDFRDSANRTELELAQWLGSHGLAVALQATLGILISVALAYVSYELFEKRFLNLKRWFETAKEEEAQADLAAGRFDEKAITLQSAVITIYY